MSQDDQHFEMWWDCPHCHATGLLGLTHRHCPHCGAAQDASRRYFPPEGKEIEAKHHRYVGADWQCGYCGSPNAASAKFCINCSAGQDGSKPVALVHEGADQSSPRPLAGSGASAGAAATSSAPRARHWPWGWLLGAVLLALLASAITAYLMTRDNEVSLVAKSWERSIAIERLNELRDSDWCDQMPSDAYGVWRSRELRSHRQVADGQTCSNERVDNGDGSFRYQKSCITNYRQEPVYDMRCSYKVLRWRTDRQVVANQLSHPEPTWPTVDLPSRLFQSKKVGTERQGAQTERYMLSLQGQRLQDSWTCTVKPEVWAKLSVGAQLTLPVRLLGGAACERLH
ncbi:hypothetical protein LNV08_05735 [Paucibacter sp. TC2R-5]|uniref:hypothetical protein n=1 Tax=Paucibacter sp. TC2R-5 TaxID=2893555 RepID=UPI0021E3D9E4|nr:hypothetical protein [Paucibacter sp. TC2R-5]MCV2358472.1 hypothetical protein [Paucibacter sp. TC2R-5]